MPATAQLFLARAAALVSGTADVQMFPPGLQTIVPFKPADSKQKAEPMTLVIDERTATDLEAARSEYQASADAGQGDAPFFDFNHDDKEAAAWPKRIYWAGDDPLLGGVRAEVEWSSSGEEAVQGKLYRRFSPAFYAADGRVTGIPINMGGLVNRAAFTAIQPLFAKADTTPESSSSTDNRQPTTDNSTPSPPPTMTPEEIAALQAENADLKNQLADLQTQLDSMECNAKAAAKTAAQSTVATCAKEGRIPASPEIQAKWVDAICANPAAAELLLAMAPNAALVQVIQAKAAPVDPPAAAPALKEGLAGLAEIIAAKRNPATTSAN